MNRRKLYLFVVLSVLIAACGSSQEESHDVPPDTAGATTERADSAFAVENGEHVILFLGNSLSAGLGVEDDQAFPNLIQDKIDSLGWRFQVVNAGISGETTSGGLSRIDWLLKQHVDILVLELGGNDGLRGISTDVTRTNLEQIIARTHSTYPEAEIVLAGMQLPPNLGQDYTRDFREIFPSLADEYDLHLIPFLLEGVGGVDSMMQPDGIHPNVQGHRKVAENVWDVLRPLLEEMRQPAA